MLQKSQMNIADKVRKRFGGVMIPFDRENGLPEAQVYFFEDQEFHITAGQDKVHFLPDGLVEVGPLIISYDKDIAWISDHL
jgi:hypothetical protein